MQNSRSQSELVSNLEAESLLESQSLTRYLVLAVAGTGACIAYYSFAVKDQSDAEVAALVAIWFACVLPALMKGDEYWTSCNKVSAAKQQQQQQR